MPQADYGTSSPPASSSATLPPTPSRTRQRHDEGHASILSSVTNLANTVIGAGALAFPSAFAAMGLIPGIVSCLTSGMLTGFGLYLLSRCATLVGKRPGDEGRKASFNEVARLTFGKGWATNLFDVGCFTPRFLRLCVAEALLARNRHQMLRGFRIIPHHM